MIGTTYPSEMSRYKDKLTNREVIRLTDKYVNYHFYFTDNSFTLGDKEIYFLSSRPNNEAKQFNVFRMDLQTGLITQVTDEKDGVDINKHTKTPDSELIVYKTGKLLKSLNTKTGAITTIFEEKDGMQINSMSISPSRRYVGVTRNEDVNIYRNGPNYAGFKEMMYAVKKSCITIINSDGSGYTDAFHDTHWLAHIQFAPDDDTLVSFCHEGPWNYVQQRIWLFDLMERKAFPCFRQEEDDSVGHEFWTRDGYIFFDNRRRGHDGTITSDKTQAVTKDAPDCEQIPFIGLADKRGVMIKKIDLPYYCNHYHANTDNTLLVGDDVENIVLADISGDKPEITVLCHHGTSWRYQITHCHPTFSWDSQRILFTSDCEGRCNLYLVDL